MVLFPITTVLAAYNYSYGVRVFNNSTTDYANGIPVLVTLNNSQLYEYGYIGADGLDTTVQEGATTYSSMVQSSRLGVFLPSLLSGQARTLNYRLGNTPARTTFPIITGIGGNVTVDDHVSLEVANNGTISTTVWLPVSQNATLLSKPGAVQVTWDYTSGNVTATIFGNPTWNTPAGASGWTDSNLARDDNTASYAWANSAGTSWGPYLIFTHPAGQSDQFRYWVTDGVGGRVTLIDLDAYYDGAWHDVYEGTFARGAYEARGMTAFHSITSFRVRFYNASGTLETMNVHEVDYNSSVFVTATGVSAGEHDVEVELDTVNMNLYIDGVVEDTTALSGVSIPNNANNWLLLDGVYYTDSFSISVNGTQQLLFQPNTMITGSVLTDRVGGDHNGTINWGANPAGIDITVGALTSAVSAVSDVVVNETAPDLLSAPPLIEPVSIISDAALVGMPLYTNVANMADSLGMSVEVAYILLIEIVAIAFGVAAFVAIPAGWSFASGFLVMNILGAGTPVNTLFFIIVVGFILVLGLFLWRRF